MEIFVIIFIVIAIINTITKDKGKNENKNVTVGNSNILKTVTDAVTASTVARNAVDAPAPVQRSVNTVKQNIKQQTVPNIVQKAKNNNAKLAKDQTLEEIEKSHGHSEKAVSKPVEHTSACQTLKKDENTVVAGESLLGNIEDLMIKGYSGEMKFERDFVSEGLSMISQFTVPDTVNF